jgi:hypothetical protein
MNKYQMYHLAKRKYQGLSYGEKNRWKKRLKFLALFLVTGTVLLGGAAIWGTVVLVNKLSSSVADGSMQENLAKGEAQLKTMAAQPITTQECLNTVGSMISPTQILTVPLAKNIESLRTACWSPKMAEPKKS